MHLVVVLPALNEEATIARVVEEIPREIKGVARVSVAVVDDGSTDRTVELAEGAGARVVSHSENLGVGAAFATAMDAALRMGADLMVNMDSDGQFNPADIPRLIAPILEGRADFVSCSRFADPELVPKMPWIKRRGNAWMTALINAIVRPKRPFTDVSCGFRAYTRETLLHLNLFGQFTYTQESFLDLATKGVRMAEVALPVRGVREFGKSRVARNLWNYAFQTSAIILRTLRDHRPLRFFGSLGVTVLLLSVAQIAIPGVNWLLTGRTTPFQSLIVTGGVTVVTGIILLAVALLADMMGRGRQIQERMLYFAKRAHYDREAEAWQTAEAEAERAGFGSGES